MGRRLAVLGLIAIAALIIWITANTIIKMDGQVQLRQTCEGERWLMHPGEAG